jgi:peptidyl-prolyl cis-trans isomerase B (cyclophilin B)
MKHLFLLLMMGCLTMSSVEANNSKPIVRMETTKGTIVLELDAEKAPITVANFLEYTKEGFYDGTIFHRVIDGFMIQGGGFEDDMRQKKTDAPIVNEASNGLLNENLTVAMARTNDPNSATSQFFINISNNHYLNYKGDANPGYAVFGKVVSGSDAIDAIRGVETTMEGGHRDVPKEDVVIKRAVVVED